VDGRRDVQLNRDVLERSLGVLFEATSRESFDVLNATVLDSRLWETATADPGDFLQKRGIELPDNVEVLLSSATKERPWPKPEPGWEIVVVRTFWWCYREPEDGPRTCLRVSLEVPAQLIS
jgi:hypothetical protein